ncbi:UDP-glycosyltransferase UGT5-like [Penaeus chinensis]|uniref:UDP-glycosyltransferase UGT5-like n=1 Tax=Penaeus chinensis TaxID=139456 RepID=UPI001FB8006B|nr:UDP-glycosyltransferase UGT5-like [Penaeus chinensis]XP_047491392.1 UDP-glycosyltransferase UGT5-like [Penaeus chinensis]
MKRAVLALALALTGVAWAELAPPERSYKILMLLPVSSKSHRNVFLPVAEGLADRGHKVVLVVNHPPVSKHPNIEEIDHDLPDFKTESMDLFATRADPAGVFTLFQKALPNLARKLYKVPKVKELYDRRKEFDIIIIDHMFNEVVYPFAHEMPFITIATPGMDARQSAVYGNVQNPAYVPSLMKTFPLPMSMLHRILNTIEHIRSAVSWRFLDVLPSVQKEISAQFPDLPSLLDIERNQSLTLMNSHFTVTGVLPLLPSQVEVGAMHCRPGKPLPKDLESWISGAGSEGVVYFSLGSVAQGQSMPKKYRDMFVEAFKQLKQRVIWKYEEALEGVSDNVLMRKWLPQQDILAHPNVRVFITHGGLLSTQESFYHSTPVLAVPIFGDQPKNGMDIQASGLGLMLVWEELTVELIVDSLQELLNNPKYKATADEVQSALRDQPQSPKDRAVFWTEYVIRHKGAPRLRSPAAQLSWVEFLMLDVLLALHVTVFVLVYLLRRLLGAICSRVFGSRSTGKKKKRE